MLHFSRDLKTQKQDRFYSAAIQDFQYRLNEFARRLTAVAVRHDAMSRHSDGLSMRSIVVSVVHSIGVSSRVARQVRRLGRTLTCDTKSTLENERHRFKAQHTLSINLYDIGKCTSWLAI